jgi:hypothetical protein
MLHRERGESVIEEQCAVASMRRAGTECLNTEFHFDSISVRVQAQGSIPALLSFGS